MVAEGVNKLGSVGPTTLRVCAQPVIKYMIFYSANKNTTVITAAHNGGNTYAPILLTITIQDDGH